MIFGLIYGVALTVVVGLEPQKTVTDSVIYQDREQKYYYMEDVNDDIIEFGNHLNAPVFLDMRAFLNEEGKFSLEEKAEAFEKKREKFFQQKDVFNEEEKLMSGTVHFNFNKWDIKKEFQKKLAKIVKTYKSLKTKHYIVIKAYTDNVGTYKANEIVANNRAKSVVDFLIENGVDENDIKWQAYPKCCYISSKPYVNRRVEVELKEYPFEKGK